VPVAAIEQINRRTTSLELLSLLSVVVLNVLIALGTNSIYYATVNRRNRIRCIPQTRSGIQFVLFCDLTEEDGTIRGKTTNGSQVERCFVLIVLVDSEHFNAEICIYKKRGTVVPNRDFKPLAAFLYSVELFIARTRRSLPRITCGLRAGSSLSPTLNADT